MPKCIVCGKHIDQTDFFCSFACAFRGVKDDAKKLEEAFNKQDQEEAEDQEYARQCDLEKYNQIYYNNPSLL